MLSHPISERLVKQSHIPTPTPCVPTAPQPRISLPPRNRRSGPSKPGPDAPITTTQIRVVSFSGLHVVVAYAGSFGAVCERWGCEKSYVGTGEETEKDRIRKFLGLSLLKEVRQVTLALVIGLNDGTVDLWEINPPSNLYNNLASTQIRDTISHI
jgi:hypothetical protein